MQVERELVVRVKTSDGIVLKPGDIVALTARGYTYVGKYLGVSGRGHYRLRGSRWMMYSQSFQLCRQLSQKCISAA